MRLDRTSCRAVVTDDGQQVVSGDLGRTLFGQERLHVEALQREGDVAADLERVHHLVSEALQVNAQDLRQKNTKIKHSEHFVTSTTCYQINKKF